MPGREETEVGERGLNLSGGQKQRLAIARALYTDADIFLVDDCLAALDSYVGKKIFHNVFLKYLKGKTIIFVTHALQYLKFFDRVLVMDQGKLVE